MILLWLSGQDSWVYALGLTFLIMIIPLVIICIFCAVSTIWDWMNPEVDPLRKRNDGIDHYYPVEVQELLGEPECTNNLFQLHVVPRHSWIPRPITRKMYLPYSLSGYPPIGSTVDLSQVHIDASLSSSTSSSSGSYRRYPPPLAVIPEYPEYDSSESQCTTVSNSTSFSNITTSSIRLEHEQASSTGYQKYKLESDKVVDNFYKNDKGELVIQFKDNVPGDTTSHMCKQVLHTA